MSRGPGVWKLNCSVLQEVKYVALIMSFWPSWRSRKHSFAFLIDWWESAKSKIKGLTITYCKDRVACLHSGRDLLTNLASHLKSQVDSSHMFCLGPYHSTLDELRKLDEAEAEGLVPGLESEGLRKASAHLLTFVALRGNVVKTV